MGAIGERTGKVKWEGDGSAIKQRVRHIRCTDNVPFNPSAAYGD